MDKRSNKYSRFRVESVPSFHYVEHTVISTSPEEDAIDKVCKYAKENGIDRPEIVGWDFPKLSAD